ncbi:MAG: hypothetical protein QXW14_02610 [Candidatus Nitrosocaldus sp.]
MSNNLNPLLPKVMIGRGNNTQLFDPLSSIHDFNLLTLDVELNVDSNPSTARLSIEGSYSSSVIDLGSRIDIWLCKTNMSSKVFTGTIESRKRDYGRASIVTEFIARSQGSRLVQRIVDIVARQRIREDGFADNTDDGTEASNLVKRIVEDVTAYPKVDGAIPIATLKDEGIDASIYVQRSGITIPVYIMQYRPALDALQELAEMTGYIFFVDGDSKLHFHQPGINSNSNILVFKDTLSSDDDPRRVGHIVEYTLEDTIEQVKNIIYGLGGNKPKISKEVKVSNAYELLTSYRAVKINMVGVERELQYIAVRIAKVGNPTVALEGELRLDDGNNRPKGALIKAFRKDHQAVASINSNTQGQWIIFDVGEDNLDVNTPHWLILFKKGDTNNTYAWYHDNGSNGINAYSSDGINWVVQNSSYQFNYRLYYSQRLLTPLADQASIDAYGRREAVVSWPTVIEDVELITLTKSQLDIAKRRKQIISMICIPADAIVRLGDAVRVVDSRNGLDAVFDVTSINYSFDQGLGDYNYKFTIKGIRFI